MTIITIPKILREKLTDEGADALVELINKANEKVKEDVITLVEEKFERRLSEEIGKLRAEIGTMRGELRAEMNKMYANIVKWMFIFIFGQFWIIIGTLVLFFRK